MHSSYGAHGAVGRITIGAGPPRFDVPYEEIVNGIVGHEEVDDGIPESHEGQDQAGTDGHAK